MASSVNFFTLSFYNRMSTNGRPTRFWGKLGVHGHNFKFCLFNMDYILSCRCSAPLSCYAVDLVPLTFLILRIISSHDLKKNQNIRL
jgi:hypothetical protein